MKNLLLSLSLLLLIVGAFNFLKYAGDYSMLSDYGKGYLFGSTILLLVGSIASIIIIRRKMTLLNRSV